MNHYVLHMHVMRDKIVLTETVLKLRAKKFVKSKMDKNFDQWDLTRFSLSAQFSIVDKLSCHQKQGKW